MVNMFGYFGRKPIILNNIVFEIRKKGYKKNLKKKRRIQFNVHFSENINVTPFFLELKLQQNKYNQIYILFTDKPY